MLSTMARKSFDLLVIGAGSGGMATARRAAALGAKVGVVESGALGGTCVNVGCVPKKVMWSAAAVREMALNYGPAYGFEKPSNSTIDFGLFKKRRDAYVAKLNGIYARNLDKANIELFRGHASFAGDRQLDVSDASGKVIAELEGTSVLVAPGGRPTSPSWEGGELAVDSNGFFEMETLPKSAIVVGAGYIAVELAGVLNALGVQTELVTRKEGALRGFDELIRDKLNAEYEKKGVRMHHNTGGVKKMWKDEATGLIRLETVAPSSTHPGSPLLSAGAEIVFNATGRQPNVDGMNLAGAGIELDGKGFIKIDSRECTTAQGVYALGDVVDRPQLTPVAIKAGRALGNRLFGPTADHKADRMNYNNIATVVFSHPPVGVVGLTQAEAEAKYGADNIKCFRSVYTNMFFALLPADDAHREQTGVKMVCEGPEQRVRGLHIIGMGADEMLQGFAMGVRLALPKVEFDQTCAIHPTSAEEVVTITGLPPPPPAAYWGERSITVDSSRTDETHPHHHIPDEQCE